MYATITPALATAWENVKFTPVTGTPYQQVNLIMSSVENKFINDVLDHEELGFLQIRLAYPVNVGAKNAEDRAQLIRSTFYNNLKLSETGLKIIINQTPEVRVLGIDGDRFEIVATVYFKARNF